MPSSDASKMAGSVVLIVEDEALIRMRLAHELEVNGFRVFEAENADQAMVKLLDEHNIGFVVTDLRMPGSIDGLGLAAWMRVHTPLVPIIITSGFGIAPDTDTINSPLIRIVTKPYRPGDVPGWLQDFSRSVQGKSADVLPE